MISIHVMKVYKPGINYLNYILQPSNIFVPFNPLMVSVAKTGLKIQIVSLSLKKPYLGRHLKEKCSSKSKPRPPSNAEATFVQGPRTQRSKSGHIGIHWMAITEYSQMSIHSPFF